MQRLVKCARLSGLARRASIDSRIRAYQSGDLPTSALLELPFPGIAPFETGAIDQRVPLGIQLLCQVLGAPNTGLSSSE